MLWVATLGISCPRRVLCTTSSRCRKRLCAYISHSLLQLKHEREKKYWILSRGKVSKQYIPFARIMQTRNSVPNSWLARQFSCWTVSPISRYESTLTQIKLLHRPSQDHEQDMISSLNLIFLGSVFVMILFQPAASIITKPAPLDLPHYTFLIFSPLAWSPVWRKTYVLKTLTLRRQSLNFLMNNEAKTRECARKMPAARASPRGRQTSRALAWSPRK